LLFNSSIFLRKNQPQPKGQCKKKTLRKLCALSDLCG
jgi:hypothetical protein